MAKERMLIKQGGYVALVTEEFDESSKLTMDSIDDKGVCAIGGNHEDVIAEFEELIHFHYHPEDFDEVW